MPHHAQGGGVFFGQNFEGDFAVGRQRRIEAHGLAVDHRGHGGLGQPRPDVGGDIFGPYVLRIGFDDPSGSLTLSMVE